MDRKELTAAIKRMAKELGADMVGIAPVSRWDGAPHMLTPQAHLPEAKSVVCLGVHHPDASVDWCGEPNPNFPAAFQIGMIPKLDAICFRMSKWLEEQGYATIPQPCTTYWRHRKYKDIPYEHAASWSHMSAFVAAGLGEYGYHGMVMSPEYGPRERIISFITAAELEPDALYSGEPLCDSCLACARHCAGRNYEIERLNDPKFIEFKMEDKSFRYPNINRWRCFYGEQAHLDTTILADIDDMDEEKIYDEVEKGQRMINDGYMCGSFKHCMTPKKRYRSPAYAPGALRKKNIVKKTRGEMMKHIIKLALNSGADRITVQPLSEFTHLKPNFNEGFRVDQFYDSFTTVITVGRYLHNFSDADELNRRNGRHLKDAFVDRISTFAIDATRYLDDLGYEAIQDWYRTGISRQAAKNAGWEKDDKYLTLSAIICNIPFENDNQVLREWNAPCVPALPEGLNTLSYMNAVCIGNLEDVTYPGMAPIRAAYPFAKTIVVLAEEIPERVTELACAQEAEDGAAYAFAHYEIHKESLWAAADLCDTLETQGYKAVPLADLAPESKMTIGKFGRHMPDLRANAPFAVAGGLGTLGKSGLVLNDSFGSRTRYSFVLTDAPLATTAAPKQAACPQGCTACAAACPMQALVEGTETVTIRENEVYTILKRDETLCAWARSLAMCEGAGSAQLGWKIPDIKVPDLLTPAIEEEVAAQKDKIQTLCYRDPHFIDMIVERCLQACPIGKK
ncbi:MAG: hypothetical protein J6K62_03865 [Clostridia bacterium]|nr:hypothetical protein [Clostridia bacterium]